MLASDFLLSKPGNEQKECLLWYVSCLSQQWLIGEQDSTVIYLLIKRGFFKCAPITKKSVIGNLLTSVMARPASILWYLKFYNIVSVIICILN